MHSIIKPIGVLGGTFDPIHLGHLRMALELYEVFKLETVHFVPSFQPAHRVLPIATALQRLDMVELAIENEPAFVANSCEIQRQGISYTVDTLEELREANPQTPLCLMVGIDAFLDFLNWHKPQGILRLAHVIVAHRPNYQLPSSGPLAEFMQNHLQNDVNYTHKNKAGGILLRAITSLEISATEIRHCILSERSPRYLLPDSVYEYIKEHDIYRTTRT